MHLASTEVHFPPASLSPHCHLPASVDEHFDPIMAELLKEIGGRLWRSRQASCLALADLLVGRRWAQVGRQCVTAGINCRMAAHGSYRGSLQLRGSLPGKRAGHWR